MTQAKQGDTVKVHFTGKLEDGKLFGTTTGQKPLQFTIGKQEVIPGFEKAVLGMHEDESKTAEVKPDDGFGLHDKKRVFDVDKNRLPENMEPEIGQTLKVTMGNSVQTVKITDISESKVTLDANHPLAGKRLLFDIKLVEIIS